MKGTHIITVKGPSLSTIRNDSIKIAKEIGYPKYVLDLIKNANSQSEINRILADARHEWDVNPGRYFNDYDIAR